MGYGELLADIDYNSKVKKNYWRAIKHQEFKVSSIFQLCQLPDFAVCLWRKTPAKFDQQVTC
jgi:hypothetical protein